jgi:transcription termination factor Rho
MRSSLTLCRDTDSRFQGETSSVSTRTQNAWQEEQFKEASCEARWRGEVDSAQDDPAQDDRAHDDRAQDDRAHDDRAHDDRAQDDRAQDDRAQDPDGPEAGG